MKSSKDQSNTIITKDQTKKQWTKPELIVLSVKSDTLGKQPGGTDSKGKIS